MEKGNKRSKLRVGDMVGALLLASFVAQLCAAASDPVCSDPISSMVHLGAVSCCLLLYLFSEFVFVFVVFRPFMSRLTSHLKVVGRCLTRRSTEVFFLFRLFRLVDL